LLKRVATKRQANIIVSPRLRPERFPCLIVDSSPGGFRVRGGLRLRRGQVVEVIPEEELTAVRCSVVWIGKRGSKHEGEVGLKTV
jgi:hypothetical protein